MLRSSYVLLSLSLVAFFVSAYAHYAGYNILKYCVAGSAVVFITFRLWKEYDNALGVQKYLMSELVATKRAAHGGAVPSVVPCVSIPIDTAMTYQDLHRLVQNELVKLNVRDGLPFNSLYVELHVYKKR